MSCVEQQVVVDLQVGPEGIPVGERLADPEDHRIVLALVLERTEHTVPEDQDAAIILVDVTLVLRMMHTVIRRRHEYAVQHAHAADELGMHPELVDQVDRVDGHQHLERKADHEQRHVENPAEDKTGAGLPQRRGQVVVLALVVHGMRCPEHGYLVTETVEPVVAEVPGQRSGYPERDAARRDIEPGERHVDECEILQHEAPGNQRQQLGKVAYRRAQRAGAEAIDRVVGAIQASAAAPVQRQFDE